MTNSEGVFVINLPHRTDRRSEMEKQLSRVGWNARFFSGVKPETANGFSSVGAHGCFLSHLEVLRLALRCNMTRCIVLEDDVNFVSNFSTRWEAALKSLAENDWSIFYPGHTLAKLPTGVIRIPSSTKVLCTHFVVVHQRAIPRLIDGLEKIMARPPGHPLGGPMHVDGAYSTIRAQNPTLVTFVNSPMLGFQRSSASDIADRKWFDRIDALKPAVRLARRIKSLSARDS